MILPIVVAGHPVLRKKSEEINSSYPELEKLIQDLFETMENSDGVGLAAPQIGKAIKLFVIDAQPLADEENPDLKDFRKVFINPKIIEETGEEWLFNEGCLSVPGIREDVARKSTIKLEFYDEKWTKHQEIYEGIKARIIQHEYDHLLGILFTDKLSFLKKKMIKRKISDISKGLVDVSYKIKTQ